VSAHTHTQAAGVVVEVFNYFKRYAKKVLAETKIYFNTNGLRRAVFDLDFGVWVMTRCSFVGGH
jgi:hypothetical protein